jgi:multidrug resistance efflux pump
MEQISPELMAIGERQTEAVFIIQQNEDAIRQAELEVRKLRARIASSKATIEEARLLLLKAQGALEYITAQSRKAGAGGEERPGGTDN